MAGVKDRKTESSEMRKVIGIAVVMASRISQIVSIEHCALMAPGNQWVMEVQCRTLNGARDIGGGVLWESLPERHPDAKVEVKHNSVTVTLPPIQEYLEVAVFGTPGENDMIRKQIAIFGPKPEKGLNWTINIILYDDTEQAFEHVRQKERGKGNKLLTARAGLFVANIEDNINIDLSVLQPGWRIEGSKIKVIKSRDAWKMPEDGADFPRRSYEIVHVDESKEFFICGITVSHGEETTKAEVVAIFKQTLQKRQEEAATTRSGHQKQTLQKRQEEAATTGSDHQKQVIKSRDAWKMPEDGADFPRRSSEIVHVDESKEIFIFGITVSHGEDTSTAEWAAAILKQTLQKRQEEAATTRSGHQKQTVEVHIIEREREKKIEEEILITYQHKRAVTRYGKCLQGGETMPFGNELSNKGTELKDAWKVLLNFSGVARRRRNDTHFIGTNESFTGRITVSHGEETTKAEVVKIWKQTAGAHISDKEREKKIQEESLVTSDEHKRDYFFVAMVSCSLIQCFVVFFLFLWTECSEAVTRNGKPNTTAIIAVRPWCLLKALVKCFLENAETPLEQIGGVRANYQSRLLNKRYDSQRQRDLMAGNKPYE